MSDMNESSMNADSSGAGELHQEANVLLSLLRRRRVTRSYAKEPIGEDQLVVLAEAAQRIPTGSGYRQGNVIVVRKPSQLRRLVAVSPGIPGEPAALIVLCVDWSTLPPAADQDALWMGSVHVDLGAAAQNVLVMAEALGLGACPVMSYHRASVKRLLRLPVDWEPHVMVALGHPRAGRRRRSTEADVPVLWDSFSNSGGRQDG